MSGRTRTLQNDIGRIIANLDHRWVRAASGEVNSALRELFAEVLNDRVSMIICYGVFPSTGPDIAPFLLEWSKKVPVYVPRFTQRAGANNGFIRIQDPQEVVDEAIDEASYLLREELGVRVAEEGAGRVAFLLPVSAFNQSGEWIAQPDFSLNGVFVPFLSTSCYELIGVGWSLQLVPDQGTEQEQLTWICHERGFLEVVPEESYKQSFFTYDHT
jgi:hypothetical protein